MRSVRLRLAAGLAAGLSFAVLMPLSCARTPEGAKKEPEPAPESRPGLALAGDQAELCRPAAAAGERLCHRDGAGIRCNFQPPCDAREGILLPPELRLVDHAGEGALDKAVFALRIDDRAVPLAQFAYEGDSHRLAFPNGDGPDEGQFVEVFATATPAHDLSAARCHFHASEAADPSVGRSLAFTELWCALTRPCKKGVTLSLRSLPRAAEGGVFLKVEGEETIRTKPHKDGSVHLDAATCGLLAAAGEFRLRLYTEPRRILPDAACADLRKALAKPYARHFPRGANDESLTSCLVKDDCVVAPYPAIEPLADECPALVNRGAVERYRAYRDEAQFKAASEAAADAACLAEDPWLTSCGAITDYDCLDGRCERLD